jgi:hypothetical protein
MNFSHFLLTQFNLKYSPKLSEESYKEWISWTRNRIELFKNYCLPSILNQSNKEFMWIIFFDKDTPSEFFSFKKELERYDFIRICYLNGMEDFFLNYIKEVKNYAEPSDQWIMTTRLDNDDMLHRDAMKLIRENFIPKDKFMISLASGYVLDIDRKVLSHYFYPMSPFISLVESLSNSPVGIFVKPHTQWNNLRLFVFNEIYLDILNPTKRLARFILEKPMWIQTFHGKNVSNSFYRGLPVRKDKVLNDFGIRLTSVGMKLRELPKFANYVIWKRYLKSFIVKLILQK